MRVSAKLLRRKAYGLDVSGEVADTDVQQPNIEDEAEPWTNNETPTNAANSTVDTAAIEDFPELGERMQRRLRQFPGKR